MNFKVLFGALLVFVKPALAQTDTVPVPTSFVTFSPQHLFINGYHFYLEKSVPSNTQHSIIYSPRFYAGKTSAVDELAGRGEAAKKQGRVRGYGAEINHRFYFSKTATSHEPRFYLAYGPNFHYFQINFKEMGWAEELGPDGLKYYQRKNRTYQQKINRLGAMAVVGRQQPLYSDRFLLDMYLGFAFTKSYIISNLVEVRYTETAIDYGYSGLNLLIGIKLGIAF